MRAILLLTGFILLLAAGAYYLYNDPRIRDLFRPVAPPRKSAEVTPARPTSANGDSSESRSRPASRTPKGAHPAQVEPPAALIENQTPNATVQRVLMQILAAKRMSDGISIAVTDTKVIVTGMVDGQERRQAILRIIDNGREARQIDATGLTARER